VGLVLLLNKGHRKFGSPGWLAGRVHAAYVGESNEKGMNQHPHRSYSLDHYVEGVNVPRLV
jgi:hypothetical protein